MVSDSFPLQKVPLLYRLDTAMRAMIPNEPAGCETQSSPKTANPKTPASMAMTMVASPLPKTLGAAILPAEFPVALGLVEGAVAVPGTSQL
jgi:hypothetical protein